MNMARTLYESIKTYGENKKAFYESSDGFQIIIVQNRCTLFKETTEGYDVIRFLNGNFFGVDTNDPKNPEDTFENYIMDRIHHAIAGQYTYTITIDQNPDNEEK